jgi:hypothetical protein
VGKRSEKIHRKAMGKGTFMMSGLSFYISQRIISADRKFLCTLEFHTFRKDKLDASQKNKLCLRL